MGERADISQENFMSKKTTSNSVTTASIKEQTAAFLEAGGTVEYIVKGKSGQLLPAAAKQMGQKNR